MASHSDWFRDVVIMDGSYINTAFDNRRLAGQHDGGLVTEKVQTQLHKDEQEIENEQKDEKTEVEEANKSDEPSESSDESDKPGQSSRLDRSFVPTV